MAKVVEEYKSLEEFYTYICNTPINEAFRWAEHHSSLQDNRFCTFSGTQSFEEAVDLMRHGWTDMAQQLTQKLKAVATMAPIRKPRNVLGIAGYQPVVPLYLAGVPTSMVDKQMVAVKSKVLTVTKMIDYRCDTTTKTIINESVKTLQIIKQLEAQGYRCNIYVASGMLKHGVEVYCKVKIKSANEKLQVSKVAFPLVHPSMLRRLMFRYTEVHPAITKAFNGNYGEVPTHQQVKQAYPNDIVLPAIYRQNCTIRNVDDLKATL